MAKRKNSITADNITDMVADVESAEWTGRKGTKTHKLKIVLKDGVVHGFSDVGAVCNTIDTIYDALGRQHRLYIAVRTDNAVSCVIARTNIGNFLKSGYGYTVAQSPASLTVRKGRRIEATITTINTYDEKAKT